MPYLKIKTNTNEWTVINDLNLDKLTIKNGGTLVNNGTISGGTISGSAISGSTISGSTIQSTNADESKKIEITGGTLKIGEQDLDAYLTTKTSACSIWSEGNQPTPTKEGDLLIEKRNVNGNIYNLLWYCEKVNGQFTWQKVNAIWG